MLKTIWDTINKLEFESTTDQVTDQATDQVKQLLAVVANDTLSAVEIMNLLKLSHRHTFRTNYLNPAIQAGFIEPTHPNAPRAKNQKYRKCIKEPSSLLH